MPQTSYTFPALIARAGLLTNRNDAASIHKVSKQYPSGEDTWTVTIGGTAADGTYSFDVDGTTVSFARGSAEDDDAIASALNDAAIANVSLSAEFVFSVASAVITITHRTPGKAAVVDNTAAPGGATTVAANSAPPNLVDLGAGLVLISPAAGECGLPTSVSAAADFIGVGFIGESALAGHAINDDGSPDGYPPGTLVPVGEHLEVWVPVEDAVTEGASPFVRTDDATALAPIGGCRSDADGGDAIVWTAARFGSSTTKAGLAKLKVRL